MKRWGTEEPYRRRHSFQLPTAGCYNAQHTPLPPKPCLLYSNFSIFEHPLPLLGIFSWYSFSNLHVYYIKKDDFFLLYKNRFLLHLHHMCNEVLEDPRKVQNENLENFSLKIEFGSILHFVKRFSELPAIKFEVHSNAFEFSVIFGPILIFLVLMDQNFEGTIKILENITKYWGYLDIFWGNFK